MPYVLPRLVPYIRQQNMTECWWVSLQMIMLYHGRPIPATPAPAGLSNNDFEAFASRWGLRMVWAGGQDRTATERQNMGGTTKGSWTLDQIAALLEARGPLWTAYSMMYGHIVVVTEVTATEVVYHDPLAGMDMHTDINTFNLRLTAEAPCHFMYLPL